MLQNFFYTFAGAQVLRLALLWGLFWGQFSKISKFGFNLRKRYFYCETNTTAFHSKLLEHIGNKLQNFFYLFLGPQILNLAFLKGSFLPTFLPNIENLNLRLFVGGYSLNFLSWSKLMRNSNEKARIHQNLTAQATDFDFDPRVFLIIILKNH